MPRLTIAEFAAVSVRLAHVNASHVPGNADAVGASVARLLDEAKLTADEWDAESSHWEEELSRALDNEDEVPQLILDYSTAVQAAQRAIASPIPLETFSQILGAVQRGKTLDNALRQHHVSLPDFLSAQRHWMERAAAEADVRHALEASLR